MLSIVANKSDIENRTKQWIDDISLCNNEHIIQCYNITQYNIPEEPRSISFMTPDGFINSQDESMCYVNFSFQVIFFNIYFQIVNDEY